MASKRRIRRKSCSNKRAYTELADAKMHAFQLNRKAAAWRLRVTPYKCGFCGLFHVGHNAGGFKDKDE